MKRTTRSWLERIIEQVLFCLRGALHPRHRGHRRRPHLRDRGVPRAKCRSRSSCSAPSGRRSSTTRNSACCRSSRARRSSPRIAMAVALPLGLLSAIYLSEFAPPRVRAHRQAHSRSCWPACRRSSTATSRCCSSRRCCRSSCRGLAGFNALVAGHRDGHHDPAAGVVALAKTRCTRCRTGCAKAPTRSARRACRRRCAWWCRRRCRAFRRRRSSAVSRAIGETMIVAVAAGQQPRLDAQSARADRNDDRVHRAGEHGRHAGRHDRIPHHLRGRHAALPGDLRAEPVQQLAPQRTRFREEYQ